MVGGSPCSFLCPIQSHTFLPDFQAILPTPFIPLDRLVSSEFFVGFAVTKRAERRQVKLWWLCDELAIAGCVATALSLCPYKGQGVAVCSL